MESCPSGRRSTIGNRVGGHKLSRGFESLALRHIFITYGPLVKWLRHLPFTEVTGVRIPYGSPYSYIWRLSSAGRASALQAEGRRFDPVSLHHILLNSNYNVAGWSSPVARRAHNPKAAGSNPAPATNYGPVVGAVV